MASIRRPPSPRQLIARSLLISAVLFLLVATTYLLRPQILEDIEGRLLDARFKLRGPIATSGLVATVAVDESSIEEFGRWPWSRELIAALITRLAEAGVGAIGLDIVFSEPQPDPLASRLAELTELTPPQRAQLQSAFVQASPDRILAEAMRSSGRVIAGQFFYRQGQYPGQMVLAAQTEAELLARSAVDAVRSRREVFPAVDAVGVRTNIPLLAAAANGAGYFNFVLARDGVVRDAVLTMRYRDHFYPSLALKTLSFYLDQSPVVIHAEEFGIRRIAVGSLEIPTDEAGGIVLNYRGPAGTIPRYSASDVLHGRLPPGALNGAIVLLGVTAIGVFDAHTTPFGPSFPGLEIQANVLENIIQGDYIHHSALELLTDLLVILVLLLGLALLLPLVGGIFPRSVVAVALIAAYGWINLHGFERYQVWLNLAYPLLGWILGYIALNVFLTVVVERRLSAVNTAFQYYLHPELVRQLTHRPELLQFGGEQKTLSILFADVRNFTAISERLTPPQLAKFIHCYMDPMTEQILNHRGTVDKYIGDAVMAIFGAPIPTDRHAADACNAAIDMVGALDRIQSCCPELAVIFPIRIGIGLHTGDVVVGNLGSSFRFTYTALGDNVNLASRIEGLTKTYGVSIIVTDETRRQAGDEFLFRELDRVRVKGKQQPVCIHELIGRRADAREERLGWLDRWQEALALYHQRQWPSARESFEALLSAGDDRPARLYIERCARYEKEPPARDWDGVTTFERK